VQGGLIWERGRRRGEWLAPLAARAEPPSQWRIVLATPVARPGLSGESERDAFGVLPRVPPSTTKALEELAEDRILPAAKSGNVDEFGEAIFEYGQLAGACFAAVQGGAYASAAIAKCVATIRALGVRGVGQTSWGPTVYAIVASDADAAYLVQALPEEYRAAGGRIVEGLVVARPDNRGAVIRE
jgi:beta-RFAP synthase